MLAMAGAKKAGFVLANPQALDNRTVILDFEQMPAAADMQLIAQINGMRVVFNEKCVRFETT